MIFEDLVMLAIRVGVLVASNLGKCMVDANDRPEKASETAPCAAANSAALLDFLNNNRSAAALRLSPEEIDNQIREEREACE